MFNMLLILRNKVNECENYNHLKFDCIKQFASCIILIFILTRILYTFVSKFNKNSKAMSEEAMTSYNKIHHGRNIKRLREMLGIKQETIAVDLNITQQAMSKLEQKEQIEDETLEKVAKVLKVPIDSIKNFSEESAINVIANTFNDSSFIGYKPTFNPLDKVVELYERILKSEPEKIALLEKTLEKLFPKE